MEILTEVGKDEVRELSELLFPISSEKSEEHAEALYRRFKTLERIICADFGDLSELVGERCATHIKLLARISSRRKTERFKFGKMHTKAEIADYLKGLFLGLSVENLYVISLDAEGSVVSCDLVAVGTVNAAGVIPRQLVETAIKNNAESVILAHNHPGGNTTPSNEDTSLTMSLSKVLSKAGIKLAGHFIISGNSHCLIDIVMDV